MSSKVILAAVFTLLATSMTAISDTAQTMLQELMIETGETFSAQAGHRVWHQDNDGRSCTSCHTDSLFVPGRHERTGKVIEPMAPSVNPERLTDRKKIDKWLLRNCKWTFGRECTAQEKGDILLWLSEQ